MALSEFAIKEIKKLLLISPVKFNSKVKRMNTLMNCNNNEMLLIVGIVLKLLKRNANFYSGYKKKMLVMY